ncbi:hypothetical protein DL96DRAFT_1590886, partial [Flagelloscypha sp. PMI_526]
QISVSATILFAAALITTAKAEGCYSGGNSRSTECYDNFSEDFCAHLFQFKSECFNLSGGDRCDFSYSGPSNQSPSYAYCVYAMAKLQYYCPEHGGLWTAGGFQYKMDPNDGSC